MVMNIAEVRQWMKAHNAKPSVGTFLLNAIEHPAVVCADADRTLAICPWQNRHLPPAIYVQQWDWDGGYYDTQHVGDLPDCRDMDTDAIYSLIVGECPRCHGTGVVEALTRYGEFMLPNLLPCPECQRQESEPPLPF
jgi:hypothetical protein